MAGAVEWTIIVKMCSPVGAAALIKPCLSPFYTVNPVIDVLCTSLRFDDAYSYITST